MDLTLDNLTTTFGKVWSVVNPPTPAAQPPKAATGPGSVAPQEKSGQQWGGILPILIVAAVAVVAVVLLIRK